MNKTGIVLIIALAVLFQFDPPATRAQSSSKTIVYYFHGKFRCYSCTRIEELTRKAVQKGFSKDLSSGAMVFMPVNVDEPKNGHYMEDYKLAARSVILSKMVDGKQTAWKNLPMVWDYLNDEAAFFKYIQAEAKNFMK